MRMEANFVIDVDRDGYNVEDGATSCGRCPFGDMLASYVLRRNGTSCFKEFRSLFGSPCNKVCVTKRNE